MAEQKRPRPAKKTTRTTKARPRTMAVAHILAGDRIRHEDRELTVTDRRWHVQSDGTVLVAVEGLLDAGEARDGGRRVRHGARS